MARNILIAGGNSGIGLELVKMLSEKGNNVIAVSRNGDNLEGIDNLNYIQDNPADFNFELKDLPDSLDGLVYLPGTINLRPLKGLKMEDFEKDLNVNFLGAVNFVKQSLTALKKGNNPSIVLMSTVAVQTGLPFHTSIAAAKGALEAFMRSLAAELAPTIRVNAVAPSLTETPLADKLLNNESKRNSSVERHPLKSLGKALDQANAIHYLLSEESSWMTGQVLHVDGGLSKIR